MYSYLLLEKKTQPKQVNLLTNPVNRKFVSCKVLLHKANDNFKLHQTVYTYMYIKFYFCTYFVNSLRFVSPMT